MARTGISTAAILAAYGFLAVTGADAQKVQSSPPAETVTVLGVRKSDEKAFMDTISQFVDQHSARDRKSGLLVRDAPLGVCPVTLGLPDDYDRYVTGRVIAVAKQVGAGAQDIAKCHANIEIIFTNDPQGLVNSLSDLTRGRILGFHFVHEKKSLVHFYRPIQAWYVTGTKDDASAKARVIGRDGVADSSRFKTHIDNAYGSGPYTGTGSRIPPANSSQIVNALIIADLTKTAGSETGPVADYVALLALSQPQSLDGCNDFPSILDIMSTACASRDKPDALTSEDMAYLKALYAVDITTSGQRGSENVAKEMNVNLAPPAADRR